MAGAPTSTNDRQATSVTINSFRWENARRSEIKDSSTATETAYKELRRFWQKYATSQKNGGRHAERACYFEEPAYTNTKRQRVSLPALEHTGWRFVFVLDDSNLRSMGAGAGWLS